MIFGVHLKFLFYLFNAVIVISSLAYSVPSAGQVVVFPKTEPDQYIPRVLKHALSYSPEKNYQLTLYDEYLPKNRVFLKIANNQGIDIVASGAAKNKVGDPLAIPFPLLKGLYGWRIPLVSAGNHHLFAENLSLSEFKKLSPGQFHSWSDTKVLEGNGITVEKGTSFEGLFEMLATHRYDYFPRSILEVERDYENNKHLPISIDPHILLHYPSAYIFYVSQENTELAADIIKGLNNAHEDGSLDVLFNLYYSEKIEKVRQQKRKIYHLKNNQLPDGIPLHRDGLWLDLSQ